MIIRKYRHGEEEELLKIFKSSIRENAVAYYTKAQLESWAPNDMDFKRWEERISAINPYVMVEENMILAYADLQDSGYIDHFFVGGGLSGRGLGSQLMNHLIKEAQKKKILELTSDVSLAAQEFYLKFDFEIVKRQSVLVRGEVLENALMCKRING